MMAASDIVASLATVDPSDLFVTADDFAEMILCKSSEWHAFYTFLFDEFMVHKSTATESVTVVNAHLFDCMLQGNYRAISEQFNAGKWATFVITCIQAFYTSPVFVMHYKYILSEGAKRAMMDSDGGPARTLARDFTNNETLYLERPNMALPQMASYGWYVLRRVWFPAWRAFGYDCLRRKRNATAAAATAATAAAVGSSF